MTKETKEIINNHKKLTRRFPEVSNKVRDGLYYNLKTQSRNSMFNVKIRKSPK